MTIIEKNERTARAQDVTHQPDGPGRRIGKRAELVLFGKLTPNGAKLFYERLPQFQAEAGYWEERVGTVHDLRISLFDDDTRIMFLITYDGDFKPYIADIISQASPWFDAFMPDVWEGYVKADDPSTVGLLLAGARSSDFFYASNPDVTVRDITRMKKLSLAFSAMLDAAD